MRQKVITVFLTILILGFLALGVKGEKGNPIKHQTEHDRTTNVGSPFESSNSNSRYVLTEAIVTHGKLYFTDAQAQFAAPDIVYYYGKYFSIFTPGISFIGVPFYWVGKQIGLPQVLTFLSTTVLAVINGLLIVYIVRRYGGTMYHGILCGVIFLFATNALSYAYTFTQHHATTLVLLLMFLNVLHSPTLKNNVIFGILAGTGILFDIPNIFLMAPFVIYKLYQHISLSEYKDKILISFKLLFICLAFGLIPILAVFGWYNYQLTGSYTKIGQTIGRAKYPVANDAISQAKKSIQTSEENAPDPLSFTFNTRRQLANFYILLISNERGIFYYSPILLVGVIGAIVSYRKKETRHFVVLASSVVLVNLLLYAMFVDPWGGWAFGPRYLIPASAFLSLFVYFSLQRFQRYVLFICIFTVLCIYSVWVQTLGAMTSAAIPPKVEAVNLLNPIPYTYEYNLHLASQNRSSSLLYNLFFYKYLSLFIYIALFTGGVSIVCMIVYIFSIGKKGIKIK